MSGESGDKKQSKAERAEKRGRMKVRRVKESSHVTSLRYPYPLLSGACQRVKCDCEHVQHSSSQGYTVAAASCYAH